MTAECIHKQASAILAPSSGDVLISLFPQMTALEMKMNQHTRISSIKHASQGQGHRKS